ncbi:MAG: hypothetical protein U0990_02505 [Candidatus Nanopelagicales bacterium]|nr:hypothetical protein [Candidatus Nanopelagicales bacterium]MDZ4248942.1 hypothetical protein [Candidatus Nanopelagicales bacterium]
MDGRPNRLVICGDSIATTFGIDPAVGAHPYPEIARSRLGPVGWEVEALVFGGAMVTVTLDRLSEVKALVPDVVVLAHGTREAMLMFPRALRRFRVHPDGELPVTDRSWLLRVIQWARRAVYRSYLRVAGSALGDRVSEALRIRPFMAPQLYRENLSVLVDRLEAETDAQLILLLPQFHRMATYPWSPGALASNRSAACDLARRAAGRVAVLDPGAVLSPADFARDGAHLSAVGHESIAGLLVSLLAEKPGVMRANRP